MSRPKLDEFLHQTRYAAKISHRDFGKRVATVFMLLCVCYWTGAIAPALGLTAGILAFEIAALWAWKKVPVDDAEPLGMGLAAFIFAINVASILPFAGFALILVAEESIAFVIAGFMWIFGICVHISRTFALLPIYNLCLMWPTFGMTFTAFWVAHQTPHETGTPIDWLITAAMMVVYVSNTFDAMRSFETTHKELEKARRMTNTRLKELSRQSKTDDLTGLLKRKAFDMELARLAMIKDREQIAVFMLDLDGFKPINDSYSHDAGDAVLIEFANRLKEAVDANTLLARIGGDEFLVAVAGKLTEANALAIARRLASQTEQPVPYGEKRLSFGVSIGVALVPADGLEVSNICACADYAMFRAKALNGSSIHLYSPKDGPPRNPLEDRRKLRLAMKNHEIVPFYQPKVCLQTGQIAGFEALARWVNPKGGLIPPSEFLPAIEELGLHGEFLMHMTRCVVADLRALLSDGLNTGNISINMPEVTLANASSRNEVDGFLVQYPNVSKLLTFEITEDVFLARSKDTISESIALFRARGIRISLDDFGTGFASLKHLRELEFDELKIDTEFVADLGTDPTADVLVNGLLSIANGFGVEVIAEGVETEAQAETLRKMGCEVCQGFLYCRAIPAEEVRVLLTNQAQGTLLPWQTGAKAA